MGDVSKVYSGGCLCGEIRYEITGGQEHCGHCHCSLCRKASGAPFVTWMTVPNNSFIIKKGSLKYFQSTSFGKRGFCGSCGSQITFQYIKDPEDIDVTVATFDEPNDVKVNFHIWTSSQLKFIHLNDGLPTYEDRGPDSPPKE